MQALLILTATCVGAWAPTSSRRSMLHAQRVPPCRDQDRCFYGDIDASGGVVSDISQPRVDRGAARRAPDAALSPLEVIEQQFRAFEGNDVAHAFSYMHEGIVRQHGLDADRFAGILRGPAYDGILECAAWKVNALTPVEGDADRTVASLVVIPKPVPGCVRTAGLAGQQGITWPTFYRWELWRQDDGCWMLENMKVDTPPADGKAPLTEPLLTSESTGFLAGEPVY